MPQEQVEPTTEFAIKLRRSNRQLIENDHNLKSQDNNTTEEYGFLNYRNVKRIRLGRYEFDTWFGNAALFTEPTFNKVTNQYETKIAYKDKQEGKKPQTSLPLQKQNEDSLKKEDCDSVDVQNEDIWVEVLYFCSFCFKFTDNDSEWDLHQKTCIFQLSIPGRKMYEHDDTIIYRVNGIHNKLFCQCMCLLAKFFLDSKSIFYYVDNFDFYIVYKILDGQQLPMGFYSRELLSWENNNLSCICVFPCYQKHNLGTSLIEFSYALSKHEVQISGPEHPLSELGKIAYLKYWCRQIFNFVTTLDANNKSHTSLRDLSKHTGIRTNEILLALCFMGVLYTKGNKDVKYDYYKDQNGDSKDQTIENNDFHVYINQVELQKWMNANFSNSSSAKVLNTQGFKFRVSGT